MKTPIQELLEHFTDAWSSPSDLWKPSKVIAKIETMLEKEKDVIMEAHYAPKYGCFSEDYYNKTFLTDCDNPHCEDGIVDKDIYGHPIYCQSCK